jgi:hypothetical protein
MIMWRNKKQPVDERIEKESNRLAAKMYYLMSVLTVVVIIVKMCYKVPVYVYGLELISLVASGIYAIVSELKYGILFLKDKDEELLSIHYKNLSKAMMISFYIIIIGELLFIFTAYEYFGWVILYFVIWVIPALIHTFASIKNGWFIWGTKKKEMDGKKDFGKRTVIGALVFGLFMGLPMLFHGGTFHPEGLLWVLGMAAGWGIPFYLIMIGLMKVSEKMADKKQ